MPGIRIPVTQYATIVARKQAGESAADLAEEFNCSIPTVYNILRRAATKSKARKKASATLSNGHVETSEPVHVDRQIAASLLAYADRLARAADELRLTASKLSLDI